MIKTVSLTFIIALGLSHNAQAAETVSQSIAIKESVRPASGFKLPPLTKLYDNGFMPEPGDIINLDRPFGNWSLKCELLLSQDRRLCRTEQTMRSGSDQLTWRIVLTTDNIPYVVITTNAGIDLSSGIRMGFSAIEKTLQSPDEVGCTDKACFAAFPFIGFVQAAILGSQDVWFSYRKDDRDVHLINSMAGLKEALQASATNPYGQVDKEKPLEAQKTKKSARN
ncbi:hypothetical protein [uncultured Bartonella sp.]|uniref:hypothetical protein n=1 Tax=uncultured Bartonella sp. TaxID=104108 RepID=UPI002611B09B|nr:hypothetical protein [uncultured Bartonella sp.]